MDNQDKAAIVLKLATASPMDKPARNNSEILIDREFREFINAQKVTIVIVNNI